MFRTFFPKKCWSTKNQNRGNTGCGGDFTSFDPDMILKMIEVSDFNEEEELFDLCCEYALAKGSFVVLDVLTEVEIGDDCEKKLLMEQKKNRLLKKFLKLHLAGKFQR